MKMLYYYMMKSTALIDIRSCHNVGAIIRSAAFFGFDEVICVGITPYPKLDNDTRLPHIQNNVSNKIKKVSLGAESSLKVLHLATVDELSDYCSSRGQKILAVEQSDTSKDLHQYPCVDNFVLLMGEETSGLKNTILERCDDTLEIKQYGVKESLNVASAAAVAYAYFAKC